MKSHNAFLPRQQWRTRYRVRFLVILVLLMTVNGVSSQQMQVGVFRVDVSPPIGSPVAYAPARKIVDSLSARGIVIQSDEKPIVLCSVDWLGIANEGLEFWQKKLAKAAKTTVDRVSVHAVHQHDGLRCDFTTAKVLKKYGLADQFYDVPFLKKTVKKVAKAVKEARRQGQLVTHLGYGQAEVEKVASNRRILGDDGKVSIIRWSKMTDSSAIKAPEGLIDPWLRSVSFWNGEEPIAVLTYYATHPQSYYGQGDVTAEFVGMARAAREKALNDLPHIHFNGAAGNITAGKYNDGSAERRPVLAKRMEEGMRRSWEATEKIAVKSEDLQWRSLPVVLPLAKHLIEKELKAMLAYDGFDAKRKFVAAKHLAWLQRVEAGSVIRVSAMKIGDIYLLHLPGELFIEYQLAAQEMLPDNPVCTAAYEEYGPGYIGTEVAYSQGGYETSERASRVAPEVEKVLMEVIRKVLER